MPTTIAAPMLADASLVVRTAFSELGCLAVAVAGGSLRAVAFGRTSERAAAGYLRKQLAQFEAPLAEQHDADDYDDLADDVLDRLVRYAQGEAVDFTDIPVAGNHLSPFQRRVVRACRAIGRGQTRTYGQLAAAAGSPGAARAVGQVMATNRVPLVVPCHRVVGSGGALGGFSAPQGIAMKRRLLMMESEE